MTNRMLFRERETHARCFSHSAVDENETRIESNHVCCGTPSVSGASRQGDSTFGDILVLTTHGVAYMPVALGRRVRCYRRWPLVRKVSRRRDVTTVQQMLVNIVSSDHFDS